MGEVARRLLDHGTLADLLRRLRQHPFRRGEAHLPSPLV